MGYSIKLGELVRGTIAAWQWAPYCIMALTLNGTDQQATYTISLTVNNLLTGGWNVTITSSHFFDEWLSYTYAGGQRLDDQCGGRRVYHRQRLRRDADKPGDVSAGASGWQPDADSSQAL